MSDDHMVILPKGIWIVKIIQGVLALIVLALAAYGVSVIPYNGLCYAIFTTLYTGIILTYYFVSLHAWHAGYNWVAMLVLEIFAVLFWLGTWSAAAVVYVAAHAAMTYDSTDYYGYDWYYRLAKRDAPTWGAYLGIIAGTAAISAIEWVLFVVTLVFLSIRIHRHRKAGLPMKAGGPRTGTVANGGDAPNQTAAHGEPTMVQSGNNNNSYPLMTQEAKIPQYNQYPSGPEHVPQYAQSPPVPQPYDNPQPNPNISPVNPQQYQHQQAYVSPQPTGQHEMQ